MKKSPVTLIILSLVIVFVACDSQKALVEKSKLIIPEALKKEPNRIKVLNFATFHMGGTSDYYSTEFDEHNKDNVRAVHAIAQQLADFKPTVIVVERIPESNNKLQESYSNYLENPKMKFKHPSEIELLAFELGRLCSTKRIYGIDHKLSYEWNIHEKIENEIDTITPKKLMQKIPALFAEEEKLSLKEKLQLGNTDLYLDLLITGNADILTHVGTENNFEGADEAAKYYKRNLRMYSNLNRIDLKKEDRVFILMGGSHTAFFRDFMSRSSKYEMVNTSDYLN